MDVWLTILSCTMILNWWRIRTWVKSKRVLWNTSWKTLTSMVSSDILAALTLIISPLCASGSLPEMGTTLIFWVLEARSAMDRVIFLWVALSVECGLKQVQTRWNVFKTSTGLIKIYSIFLTYHITWRISLLSNKKKQV